MFVLVFCEMPIVCDMFSLIRVCRNNLWYTKIYLLKWEIRTDTRYFRKPCNNERPRYDVAWLRVWLFNSLTRKTMV
jgi:hypothetical protein